MTNEFGQPAKRLMTNWLAQAELFRDLGEPVQLRQLSNGRVYFSNLDARPRRFHWWFVLPVLTLLPALIFLPKTKPHAVVKPKSIVKVCEPAVGQSYAQITNAWKSNDGSEISLGALKQVQVSGSCDAKQMDLRIVLRLSKGDWVIEKVTHLN